MVRKYILLAVLLTSALSSHAGLYIDVGVGTTVERPHNSVQIGDGFPLAIVRVGYDTPKSNLFYQHISNADDNDLGFDMLGYTLKLRF